MTEEWERRAAEWEDLYRKQVEISDTWRDRADEAEKLVEDETRLIAYAKAQENRAEGLEKELASWISVLGESTDRIDVLVVQRDIAEKAAQELAEEVGAWRDAMDEAAEERDYWKARAEVVEKGMGRAWEEGVRRGWEMSGEGFNGEYLSEAVKSLARVENPYTGETVMLSL